jgi:hypothetical protein
LKSLASSIEREDGTVRDLLGELRRLSHAAHAAEAPPSSHGANSL